MAIDLPEITIPDKIKQRIEKLLQAFQNRSLVFDIYSSINPLQEIFHQTIREYSLHEEHILEIRKLIGCSTQEADAYLQIYPYEPRIISINNLIYHLQVYGDFPMVPNSVCSCCLNCHKRQWRYIGNRRGPCVYCGYYDPNIDPRFSIEVGESERFQPRETDIEI